MVFLAGKSPKIDSDFVCMLVLHILSSCECFKFVETLLEIASFLFYWIIDFEKTSTKYTISGQTRIVRCIGWKDRINCALSDQKDSRDKKKTQLENQYIRWCARYLKKFKQVSYENHCSKHGLVFVYVSHDRFYTRWRYGNNFVKVFYEFDFDWTRNTTRSTIDSRKNASKCTLRDKLNT